MAEKEGIDVRQKILEIQRKIKGFTFLTPTDCSISDLSYKRYLASCTRLLELDFFLNSLQNDDEMEVEDFIENLMDIERSVDDCTRWLVKPDKKK